MFAANTKKSTDWVYLWWIIPPVAVDLMLNDSITWSRWPILVFIIIYMFQYVHSSEKEDNALTILNERYAKGELVEEEYLKMKSEFLEARKKGTDTEGKTVMGVILILVGIVYFLKNFIFDFDFVDVWPLILIAIGLFSIFRNTR